MALTIQFPLFADDCDGRGAVISSVHRTALPDYGDCHAVGRFCVDTIDEWHWSQTLLDSIQSFLQSIWDYRMENRAKLAPVVWMWLPSMPTKTIEWHSRMMRLFPARRLQLAAHCYAFHSMFPIRMFPRRNHRKERKKQLKWKYAQIEYLQTRREGICQGWWREQRTQLHDVIYILSICVRKTKNCVLKTCFLLLLLFCWCVCVCARGGGVLASIACNYPWFYGFPLAAPPKTHKRHPSAKTATATATAVG